ncbi:MAG: bifunctional glutamate N-acetyltransferase/amino-acid acetyltransferase ArgJ [Clostridiales Family XIII bacterium]|jgi:glutamate N-acetyltransferase/amino-acid N-acetyltransferase|nr:bifunctional glutamate N-acetyltransferase/amino-acid acetyltransferase ArgJ [Clostridiales Family XIII bacterium]
MYIEKADRGLCAPKGFRASGVHVGFRRNKRKKDLALIVSDAVCSAAAVYTRNKVKSAPIRVNVEHLRDGRAAAIVCNSGNANTCAPNGMEIANGACRLTAEALGIDESDVIVCSTGVIGEPMYLEPFETGIPKAVRKLSYDGSRDAANAITTTDTAIKETAVSFVIGNKECLMGGIAKGSGMINPNMATMLCFICTDVAIAPEMLQKALDSVVLDTFNQISIDGDTSTNDTVAVLANGMAGNSEIRGEGKDFDRFCQALHAVGSHLSREIARDGEGASKLLECIVSGAPDRDIARKVSKSVIQSELVKAAMFGEDANWGRVLCAIGYSDADFSVDDVDIVLSSVRGNIEVCRHSLACDFDEGLAKDILSESEIRLLIGLNQGDEDAIAYGCDLTYDYVRINGRYRT